MSYKPILMSTPTAQALAAGRKTQTRRTKGLDEINKDPDNWNCKETILDGEFHFYHKNLKRNILCLSSQFKEDDVLWVRETWALDYFGRAQYWHFKEGIEVNSQDIVFKASADNLTITLDKKWRPSIFMPKIACRRFLKVTKVRAERLLEISEEDAIAEGIERTNDFWGSKGSRNYMYGTEKGFRHEWFFDDAPYGIEKTPSVNGITASFFTLIAFIHSWELLQSNPWVWVYEFKEVERPKDFLD